MPQEIWKNALNIALSISNNTPLRTRIQEGISTVRK
jgi:hypothetical protein